jgi:predicted amidophosphoribosyltransferase
MAIGHHNVRGVRDAGGMSLLDVVFATDCAGCGRRGGLTCRDCLGVLAGLAVPAWPRPAPPGLPPPWSVAAYADPARALLLAYKERDAVGLRGVLAVPLAVAIQAAMRADALAAPALQATPVLLVPVPSSARAIRLRGDDVVLGLTRRAAAIARRDGLAVRVVPALRHNRGVADSAGLSAQARARNLAAAFTVRRAALDTVRNATVVLTDDLITTGATLAESARALREAGARVIGAATVAATRRRGDGAHDVQLEVGSSVAVTG